MLALYDLIDACTTLSCREKVNDHFHDDVNHLLWFLNLMQGCLDGELINTDAMWERYHRSERHRRAEERAWDERVVAVMKAEDAQQEAEPTPDAPAVVQFRQWR
jgi:hypothetical protein